MNIRLLSQISILMPILFLFFVEAEPNKRLPKRAINNAVNNETGSPGNSKNEKNVDVIDEVDLKRFVLEYETELKKELERRKLETEKEEPKVKREDFQTNIEEFDDPNLKYHPYRILRKMRSPERTLLVNPDDLVTHFQNEGQKFLQNIIKGSAAVGLDIVRKLEALQDATRKELSPNDTKNELSGTRNDHENPLYYVGLAVNITLAGFNKTPVMEISEQDIRDGFLSSFKLEDFGSSMKGKDALVKASYDKKDNANNDRSEEGYAKNDDAYKGDEAIESGSKETDMKTNAREKDAEEGDTKEGDAKEDNANEGEFIRAKKTIAKENDAEEDYDERGDAKESDLKESTAEEDNTETSESITEDKLNEKRLVSTADKVVDKDLALEMRKITPSSSTIDHRRAKRNSKKDESENKVKANKNNTKKLKGKEDIIKEEKTECSLTEEEDDKGKKETERSDKEKDHKNTGEPVKEVMSDIEDVKEGTDYE